MSTNEQYPNPWSREGATPAQPRQPQPWSQQGQPSASDASNGRPDTGSQTAPVRQPMPGQAATPQTYPGQQPGTTPHPEAGGQAAYPAWNQAFGQPQAATATTRNLSAPTQNLSAPRPAKGRSRLAGILAVAILAGGVGGGVGFAASQYGGGTTTAATGSGGTTVVQADPNSPNWTAVAEVASKAVVAIDVQTSSGGGQGSGVVIDTQGHIVTNNHVVSGALNGKVTVMLGNVSYEATVVGTDPSTDLAVIKLTDPPTDLSVMEFADNQALAVGDPVMAIGNPLGLADTVTTGIVSALNRPVTTTATTEQEQQQQFPGFGQQMQQTTAETVVTAAIQTNAAINPGNSGGALVDSSGRLVGITSSIATLSSGQSQSGNIGIGFAIGSDQVRYVADQLIATGKAEHPQLGISASDVQSTGQQGAVVAQVVSGSPAEKAGLKVDDLITAVDGQSVSGSESLVALVRAGQVGKAMDLTVLRGGDEVTVTVTPIAAQA